MGGKSLGSSIFNFSCVTSGEILSFPGTLGDFLLKFGDEEGVSLRLCDNGVTGDGEGAFCEGNTFPLEEPFAA